MGISYVTIKVIIKLLWREYESTTNITPTGASRPAAAISDS
jgi:hypothetical protein